MDEEKCFRLRGSCRIALCATLAALLAGGCGGAVGSRTPSIGSESHFLAYCEHGCGPGLDCIGGICTRACLTDRATCSDLAANAACTNQSVEPGQVAVCDVSCPGGGSCAALGADYACDHGYCRQTRMDGSAGAGGVGVDCNPVGRYEVGKEGGYKPCCPGLTQLPTLSEAYVNDEATRSCVQAPVNSFSCIQGTCGDGICEEAEAPCGCGVDCPASNWRTNAAFCESFRDQSSPPDIREISITNTGSVPLYIQPPSPDCLNQYPLYELQRDGQTVNVAGILHCGESCQRVMEKKWPYGPLTVRAPCEATCPGASPVLIQPGQTLQQPVSPEVAERQLPRGCVEGLALDAVQCFSRVIPQPGNYQLIVRAARALQCSAKGDCECRPDANGVCSNRNVTANDSADLVFTLTSSNYFQNQTFEISAPND